MQELERLDSHELNALARDAVELKALAAKWPDSTSLLLRRFPANPVWRDYCPNNQTLLALENEKISKGEMREG